MEESIKFKFWNTIVGRMSEAYSLEELHKEKILWYNVKPLRYAGLKDKNRIDIYEGDILELPSGVMGVVEWLECGFIFRLKGEIIWQNLLFNIVGHYCIVGNIYKTPELLKQKP